MNNTGNVRGTEVELRTVVVHERGVAAALFLLQDVDGTLELGVRGVSARLDNNLATLNVLTLGTTQKQTTVVASLGVVHHLAEHLDTGNGGGLGLLLDTDDLNVLVDVQTATLNTAGNNGTAAGNGEDVLDRHQERLVGSALRIRDGVVAGFHQVNDGLYPLVIALESLQSGDVNDRSFLIVVLLCEQLTDLHLNELDDFLIINHVALVQCNEDVRNANLASKQNVLAGLRHRAIGCSNNQDSAVHLSSAGNHVLDVVGVARSVNVCVVALRGGVLNVGDVDGNTALLLLRSLVDHVERECLVLLRVLVSQNLGDRCGGGGLAVVDVSDGADVHMRLRTLELLLCHCMSSWTIWWLRPSQPRG